MSTEHIPLAECKHGGLYRIFSRNLSLGVFNKPSQGFIGIREKFGHHYLFTEYHWDTGPPFGTVHPKELLEMVPDEIEPVEEVMVEATEEILSRYDFHPHEIGDQIRIENKGLFKWLEEKREEYIRE